MAQLTNSLANWWYMLYRWKGKTQANVYLYGGSKEREKRKIPGLFSSVHLTAGLMEQPQLTVYQMVTFLHLGHVLNTHSINMNALKVAGQNVVLNHQNLCLSSLTIYTHLLLPMNVSYLRNFNFTVHVAHFLPVPFLFPKSHKELSTLA